MEILKKQLKEFMDEYTKYKNSQLSKLKPGSMGIDKEMADLVLVPILDRYKKIINKYLDYLINLFEKFCAEVTEKSLLMSKFISHLTIEEFRVMADNYE